jgi:hypothetical protein
MPKIASKQAEVLSFVNSNKFGIDTWITIYHFALNTHNILLTIELYGVLIEKLDKDNLLTNYNTEDII